MGLVHHSQNTWYTTHHKGWIPYNLLGMPTDPLAQPWHRWHPDLSLRQFPQSPTHLPCPISFCFEFFFTPSRFPLLLACHTICTSFTPTSAAAFEKNTCLWQNTLERSETRQDEGWSVEWVGPYRGGNAGLHTHTQKSPHWIILYRPSIWEGKSSL